MTRRNNKGEIIMNVYETIAEMVADRFNKSVDELTRDTEFIADLCADSLDQIELAMDVEEQFGLDEVPEDALMKIVTIGDLADYVESVVE
jgi:acyl carrier protein